MKEKLIRGLGLKEATALNMIDMVGIGPFITIPIIITAMNGPQCIIAWILGAVLSFMDGAVWAELGAAFPRAGGSYVFLEELYGKKKWGSFFSFLYIWQTSIQAPLVIASATIGFTQYLNYLIPLDPIEQRAVQGSLVVLLCFLLYRKITSIGIISVLMWLVVAATILWVIVAGFTHFHSDLAFTYAPNAFQFNSIFFVGLGLASTKSIYSFLGYYNVCHLGGEIVDPEKNIPKSIFISIAGIAVLYLLMQLSVLGAMPWQEAKEIKYVISAMFQRIYGPTAAVVVTVLILFVGLSSVFSAILGYSRIPYAAALDGNFFSVFGKLHPTKNFPHISLLVLCGVAFIFSLLFKLEEVITSIIVMRILVQFVGQAVGLMLLHAKNKEIRFPFRMWLYPVPAILSIAIWLFIFFSNEWKFIFGALGVITLGALLFFVRANMNRTFPFENKNG